MFGKKNKRTDADGDHRWNEVKRKQREANEQFDKVANDLRILLQRLKEQEDG